MVVLTTGGMVYGTVGLGVGFADVGLIVGLDVDGWDVDGLDVDGLDVDGWDVDGLDVDGLDVDGLDEGSVVGLRSDSSVSHASSFAQPEFFIWNTTSQQAS